MADRADRAFLLLVVRVVVGWQDDDWGLVGAQREPVCLLEIAFEKPGMSCLAFKVLAEFCLCGDACLEKSHATRSESSDLTRLGCGQVQAPNQSRQTQSPPPSLRADLQLDLGRMESKFQRVRVGMCAA